MWIQIFYYRFFSLLSRILCAQVWDFLTNNFPLYAVDVFLSAKREDQPLDKTSGKNVCYQNMHGMYNRRFETDYQIYPISHEKRDIRTENTKECPNQMTIPSNKKPNKFHTQQISEIEIEKKKPRVLFFARCSPLISALNIRFNHLLDRWRTQRLWIN